MSSIKSFSLFIIFILLFTFGCKINSNGQHLCIPSDHQDWWDVLKYDLALDFDLESIAYSGAVQIHALVTDHPTGSIEIDYQQDPKNSIHDFSLLINDRKVKCTRQFTEKSILFHFDNESIGIGDVIELTIEFRAPFIITDNGPWKSGLSVDTSVTGLVFWGFSCQEQGASFLFPCKDILADEPQLGATLSYTVPFPYIAEGNGRLVSTTQSIEKTTYTYEVSETINPYNITFYIGDYIPYRQQINTVNGQIDCTISLLREHQQYNDLLMARLDSVLQVFEYWCGPFPFSKDGCKIIESPYLGMEHQSAIAYGNKFLPGYRGTDRSQTGIGLLFDFILVHEMAHEWWGNNVSVANMCDFWINEGWASYMESLYIEYLYGREKADRYRVGKHKLARNGERGRGDCTLCTRSVQGEYDKPAAMIHQLRMIMNDDVRFRQMMQDIQREFDHQTIDSEDMMIFIQSYFIRDISLVFAQYLDSDFIPHLAIEPLQDNIYQFRWEQCVEGFDMPISIMIDKEEKWIYPTEQWTQIHIDSSDNIIISPLWLVE